MSRRLATFATLALALTLSRAARAEHQVHDPERGGRAVAEARSGSRYAFCREPPRPLPQGARALCDLAGDIPDCDGFAEACAALAPRPPEPWALRFGPQLLAFAKALLWTLVAVIALLLAVPLLRLALQAWRRRRGESGRAVEEPSARAKSADEADAGEELSPTAPGDPATWLARGDDYARVGQYALAVSAYLAAALRALDARGVVHLERHRTNGEYVRACNDGSARPALAQLARSADRAEFGRAPLEQGDVAQARTLASQIVSSSLAALALLLACGCGQAGFDGATVRDPAGHELVLDVLARSGFDVRPLGRSLASLEATGDGEEAPVLLLDLDRTALDDEARDRLFAWVRQGGVLLLAGAVSTLPEALAITPSFGSTRDVDVRPAFLPELADDEGDDDRARLYGVPPAALHGARTAGREALRAEGAVMAASRPSGNGFAALVRLDAGAVMAVASSDLLTNAGVARPENATALVALLDHVAVRADGTVRELRVAEREDGVSPPTSPLASLVRAGLGWGMVHALFFLVVLFLAYGTRHARPKPDRPPARRDFAEHVRATAALYAYTRAAPHAASALARLLVRKAPSLGARAADPATVLAEATATDRARVSALLDDTLAPASARARLAHDLERLRALRELYLRAEASHRTPSRSP